MDTRTTRRRTEEEEGEHAPEKRYLFPGGKVSSDGTCRLLLALPFTNNGEDFPDHSPELISMAYSHLSAAVLSMRHFNDRNSSVVPDIASDPVMEDCNVQFTIELTAVGDTRARVGNFPKFVMNEVGAGRPICAVVGPFFDDTAIEMSTIATGLDIPMVSHGAEDNLLTSARKHPMVTRTSVNLHPMGEAAINALKTRGRTDFLSILYVSESYGQYFSESIDNAAKEAGFTQVSHHKIAPPYDGWEPNVSVRWAMQNIKTLTYRTIFCILSKSGYETQLPFIADAAEEFGTNGADYLWIFSGSIDKDYLSHIDNANITKLVEGAGMVQQMDMFDYDPEADLFLPNWQSQSAETVQQIRALNPIRVGEPGYYDVMPDYFQTVRPVRGSGFIYDAVMSIGIGACRASLKAKATQNIDFDDAKKFAGGGDGQDRKLKAHPVRASASSKSSSLEWPKTKGQLERRTQKKSPKIGNKHLEGIVTSAFKGATGEVRFGEKSSLFYKNRARTTVTYGLFNFRKEADAEHGNYSLRYALTNILQESPVYGEGNWTEIGNGPFLFRDGSPNPPILLRDIPEQNYLSRGVSIAGLTLMSIALLATISAMTFIWWNRTHSIMKASQPVFLYILGLGAIVLITSILTLSFDESHGWTNPMLDKACQATPWLIFLGYIIIYCALFSKLWRINKVLQFARRKIEVKQVLGPFAVLLAVAVIVLSIWTAIDPLLWVRQEINEMTGETYGRCQSKNAISYIIPLVLIMVLSTCLTGMMAWKTKDIDSKFSEANWIFYTIFLQLQVLLVGIPILVILNDASADATYLGRVLVIWIITMSTILLLIGPKVARILFPQKEKKTFRGPNQGVSISGVGLRSDDFGSVKSTGAGRTSDMGTSGMISSGMGTLGT